MSVRRGALRMAGEWRAPHGSLVSDGVKLHFQQVFKFQMSIHLRLRYTRRAAVFESR